MRILIAEDDPISGKVMELLLKKNGHETVLATDGSMALEMLGQQDSPDLALLDWMMPGIEGVEVCRRIKQEESTKGKYIIMVTAREQKDDLIQALNSGADDYLVKPVNKEELFARISVGQRILGLQQELRDKIEKLQEAKSTIKELNGLIPICSYCKKIRSDQNFWEQVESFVSNNSDAVFTHSICPECYEKKAVKSLDAYRSKKAAK